MAGSRKVERRLWLGGREEKEVSRFLPRFRGLREIVRKRKVSLDKTVSIGLLVTAQTQNRY